MQGKILRDTSNGDGIIFVNNEQKPFSLEKHWKSGEPPTIGAVVEVVLDGQGEVVSVVLVDATELAKQKAQEVTNLVSANGKNFFANLIPTMGKPALCCLAGILLSSIIFTYASFSFSAYGVSENQSFTLFQLMDGGKNILFWICLFAPFCVNFIKDKKAYLSYFAPLIVFVIFTITTVNGFSSANSKIGAMSAFGVNAKFSYGLGFYIPLFISMYMAYLGFKRFKN